MRLIGKLLVAEYRRHWFRTLLVLGALVTSVAMVVVFVGGQDVTIARAQVATGQASQALGRFDLLVFPISTQDYQASQMRFGLQGPRPEMNKVVIDWLRSNRDVESILEFCETSVSAARIGQAPTTGFRPGMVLFVPLLATSSSEPPFPLERGSWLSNAGECDIVADYSLANRLVPLPDTQPDSGPTQPPPGFGSPMAKLPEPPKNTVGSAFQLTTTLGRTEARICGLVKLPVMSRSLVSLYATPETFQKITGQPAKTNRILVNLRNGVSEESFVGSLANAAKKVQQPIHVVTNEDFQAEVGRMAAMPARSNAGFFPLMRNAGMNLAILAAMFVIFTTLNMGLQERTRQLGMLRAIGMTRRQVIGLISAEVFVLALIGYVVGLAIGIAVMKYSVASATQTDDKDLTLHYGLWAGLGALAAFGATFAAAIVPAIFASRRRPLEGMASSPFMQSNTFPIWMIPIGLILVAANPVVALTELIPESWRVPIALPISCLATITGFALLMPVAVMICERLFGRLAGLVFGLDWRLLAKQLSANLWRTVGCATALMVGLGLFVTIQIWGRSMLRPFVLVTRSPDAIVTVNPNGIQETGLASVAALPGVQNVVPMIMQNPDLTDLPEHVMKSDEVIKGVFSRSVILLGCDVKALLDEKAGIIGATFSRGRPDEAFAQLANGDSCLITDSFYLRAPEKYDVGQTIEMDSQGGATQSLKYKIAGVLEIPGWQWLTKFSQMRKLGRTGGLIIVPTSTARAAYPSAAYRNFWFRLDSGKSPSTLETAMIRIADPNAKVLQPGSRPASFPASATSQPGAPSEAMAGGPSGGMGPGSGRGGRGMGGPRGMIDSSASVVVTDTRQMTNALLTRANGIIESLTLYPLVALGLSALAVIGAMMASVRVRNWEIGILRSIGMTRGQLLRMILAEGLLIGLLATVASLIFGVLVSWTGIASSSSMWGVNAVFVIPWPMIMLGVGATVVLCIIASVWPAIMAVLRAPLQLLQEGRSME